MTIKKIYQDKNVLDAATERANVILDTFDDFAVMFSGGKDSLVALHIMKQASVARGIKRIKAFFYDEEFVPTEILEFMARHLRLDWLDLHWFSIPMSSETYVLGKKEKYVQWDPNREHARPIPSWSIRDDSGMVYDQHTANMFYRRYLNGRACLVMGLRADESLSRLRGCLSSRACPYIAKPFMTGKEMGIRLGKPIYDWTESDVFKFLHDNQIEYCKCYDNQLFAGCQLRVSTPTHHASAKRFYKLKEHDPDLYQKTINMFPEMILQERYYKDDTRMTVKCQSEEDIVKWILENLNGVHRLKAMRYYSDGIKKCRRAPDVYSLNNLMRSILRGDYKTGMHLLPRKEGTSGK